MAEERVRAERAAELTAARAERLAAEVRDFVEAEGDERALDVGTGTGALALALAPLVREVVGVDASAERIAVARERAADVANVSFLEGDATRLPFALAAFDLAATARTLHHVRRPELVLAELARVTRRGGRILVIDQLASTDPLVAIEVDRFERVRDPSHTRLQMDGDLRAMFEMNGLVLLRSRIVQEERPLEAYLDLAGCEGDEREQAAALAPRDPHAVEVGWYLLRR